MFQRIPNSSIYTVKTIYRLMYLLPTILQICNYVEQVRKISSGDSTGFLKYLRLCLSKYSRDCKNKTFQCGAVGRISPKHIVLFINIQHKCFISTYPLKP